MDIIQTDPKITGFHFYNQRNNFDIDTNHI